MSEVGQRVLNGRLAKGHRVYRLTGQFERGAKRLSSEQHRAGCLHLLWMVKVVEQEQLSIGWEES